jgi:membrane associated rhomboid family serine protease
VVDIPAAVILIYWFITQLFSGAGSIAHTHVSDQGVAWFAHIGGFVTGMLLIKLMGTRQRYFPRRDIYW